MTGKPALDLLVKVVNRVTGKPAQNHSRARTDKPTGDREAGPRDEGGHRKAGPRATGKPAL